MTENKKDKQVANYVKYSGMAFQMFAIIGVFAFIGYKIDKNRGTENLLFTALFGVVGVVVSLYQIIRSLNKNK